MTALLSACGSAVVTGLGVGALLLNPIGFTMGTAVSTAILVSGLLGYGYSLNALVASYAPQMQK